MRDSLALFVIALALTTGITPGWAAQVRQKGVHVQLAVTRNAVAMPDADQANALIVAVTAEGRVYLGITPVNFTDLAQKLRGDLATRTEKKLYIKADARTLYSNVAEVLNAVRTTGVQTLALLTSQREPVKPGTRLPPMGLEVLTGPPSPSSKAAVVELFESRDTLKVNNETVSRAALSDKLKQFFHEVVLLKAEGTVPYADAVDVVDTCRSMGAKVVLAQ